MTDPLAELKWHIDSKFEELNERSETRHASTSERIDKLFTMQTESSQVVAAWPELQKKVEAHNRVYQGGKAILGLGSLGGIVQWITTHLGPKH